MKKLITLFLLATLPVMAQENSITLTPQGGDAVVFKADNKTAAQLYQKAFNWVQETYKNPDQVLKAKVENEMIRIEGFGTSAFSRKFQSGNVATYDVNYTLQLEFQDGKYRAVYTHNEIKVDGGKVFFSYSDVLNNVADKNGNGWDGAKAEYETYVNKLLKSLNDYINGTVKKSEW